MVGPLSRGPLIILDHIGHAPSSGTQVGRDHGRDRRCEHLDVIPILCAQPGRHRPHDLGSADMHDPRSEPYSVPSGMR